MCTSWELLSLLADPYGNQNLKNFFFYKNYVQISDIQGLLNVATFKILGSPISTPVLATLYAL